MKKTLLLILGLGLVLEQKSREGGTKDLFLLSIVHNIFEPSNHILFLIAKVLTTKSGVLDDKM